ncbi:Reverse transcriptase domain [Cinara cedri]|uniref:Reverse transcriptase domain n=1 Tax=Cinara cedri TaxID=506608 RepID=A0A5E4N6C3_9HEMI|nr:Reverse transcriptase domain [Cinara cedri]
MPKKKGGNKLFQQLHKLITDIWEQEEIPESWKISVLCPVYKKGDKMDPKNYRGISLLNTSYKILSNLLLNRLKSCIKEIIGEYQAGFMVDVHMLFVDFKTAYDSVDRKKLWNVMSRLGIPEKLTRIIKVCVQGSKCKVSFGGTYSNEFPVSTGLRQGDALSPALFNIALESMVRQVLRKAERLKLSDDQQLTIVAYADDLSGRNKRKIDSSKQMLFWIIHTIQSKLLSRRSKTTLYKVLIGPIALYACETWVTTKMDEKNLGVLKRKILRKIFGPKKNEGGVFEIRANEELRELFGEADIIGIMKSSRIR